MIVDDQHLFEHGPVVAGVDGSELNGAVFGRVVVGVSRVDGPGTVRWAAAEAHSRHAELRLVTAGPNEVAGEDLAGLTRGVAAEWPDLAVVGNVTAVSPAATLRAAMAEADLLVVGADDASPFIEAMSGPAPGDLLTASHCPLAVVPRQGWKPRRSSAPVVVALNESAVTLAAIAYGYVAAARNGSPLTILRCVATGQRGDVVTLAQARMLVEYGELYPDVVVAAEVVPDDPRRALTAISRRASLLVLGSRGRLASGLFGSVSRDLIRRSGCPVVIARTPPSAVVLPL